MAVCLEKALHRCGKGIYVTYFEMWDISGFDEQPIREKLRQAGKEEDGITICIQAASTIAESGLQREALKIIANSARVDSAARDKARVLLRN